MRLAARFDLSVAASIISKFLLSEIDVELPHLEIDDHGQSKAEPLHFHQGLR
jgi:hypothetical protein